ncbi:MAG: DUF5672 family protein [Sphingobacteriaceae bacterium]
MHKKLVSIIIPFYKNNLSENERLSLQQCFKLLHNYPIFAIKPLQLDGSFLNEYSFSETISFDDSFFQNIQGYNRLMLSDRFYKHFLDFEFILIYQLDAFVFKDDLTYWCKQGYDYIGAPWLNYTPPRRDLVKRTKEKLLKYFHTRYNIYIGELPSSRQFHNRVGNGGFSLRRVQRFYNLCKVSRVLIEKYNNENEKHFNEDVFWSIEINRKNKKLKIPLYQSALQFAFESDPENAFRINDKQLPFGCHAWEKYPDFWQPIFKELGYMI